MNHLKEEKRNNTDTFFLIRVYIEENRLTPEAKTHLNAATLRPYNTSVFLEDITTEAAKSNAKIWVSLCSLLQSLLKVSDSVA